MRILFVVLLFVFTVPAFAGGDYVHGRITSFFELKGTYYFDFVEHSNRTSELMKGCRNLKVRIKYGRVPCYSWLPFVHSSHPTSEQTEEAIKFLHHAYQESHGVYFGYIGYGLAHTDESCVFESKGLQLSPYEVNGTKVVLSFHDPV